MNSPGPPPWQRILPLLAVGASSLIWQVASARSIMAGLYGNELVLGLVLGAWLALMGGATAAASRLARALTMHQRQSLTRSVLLLCPAAILTSAGLQQATLPGVTAVGQVVGPGGALISAVACLAPPCLALGGAFGLLASLAPAGVSRRRWAAWIYLVESLGMAAAGVLFHFWLARLSLLSVGLAAGLAPWLAALLVGGRAAASSRSARRARGPARRSPANLAAGVVGLGALLYLAPLSSLPGSELLRVEVPGYEVLQRRNSRHGALTVLRREDQVLFSANGHVIFSNQDHRRLEEEVHLSLLCHPRPASVLLVGGGPEAPAVALEHPVERLHTAEMDHDLVDLVRRWREVFDTNLEPYLDNRGARLFLEDGRQVMARSPGFYDVILVILPGPSSALYNRFYTDEALIAARRALRPGGLLSLSLEGKETYLAPEMALVHATVRGALKRVFGNVVSLPGGRTLLLSGRDRGPVITPGVVASRYEERRLRTEHLGQSMLMARAMPFAREGYDRRLDGVRPLRNTDLRPAAYFHASLQWLSISAPALSRQLTALAAAAATTPWLFLLGPLLVAALATWLTRRRPLAACLAVFAAGFCGMVTELSLLLACQQIRGLVYHELAALLTAFMIGLSGGAWAGRWLVNSAAARGGRVLAVRLALGACILGALAALGAMELATALPGASLPIFLAAMIVLGLAVGACFSPVAAAMASSAPGDAAARAYAWDLAGAACGALLASAFALPVLGLPACCVLSAAVCLGCLLTY